MKRKEEKRNLKQGHWIMAKLGKRVLRPGGLDLTKKMLENLNITTRDDVVELAPGLGITAKMTCRYCPKSYTGIDLNEEAAAIVRKKIAYEKARVLVSNAMETGLPSSSVDKVYCEAMLTMQTWDSKQKIMKEAARILRKDGYYAIHEICLVPENISGDKVKKIHQRLKKAIQVDASPITVSEWKKALEAAGFEVVKYNTNGMHLLEPYRILQDEGLFRTLKIICNALLYPSLRKRVLSMRNVFRTYRKEMRSVTFLARKR